MLAEKLNKRKRKTALYGAIALIGMGAIRGIDRTTPYGQNPEPAASRVCSVPNYTVDDILEGVPIEKAVGVGDYLDLRRTHADMVVFMHDNSPSSVGLARVVQKLVAAFPQAYFVAYESARDFNDEGQNIVLPALVVYRDAEQRRTYQAYAVRERNIDAAVARITEDVQRVFAQ